MTHGAGRQAWKTAHEGIRNGAEMMRRAAAERAGAHCWARMALRGWAARASHRAGVVRALAGARGVAEGVLPWATPTAIAAAAAAAACAVVPRSACCVVLHKARVDTSGAAGESDWGDDDESRMGSDDLFTLFGTVCVCVCGGAGGGGGGESRDTHDACRRMTQLTWMYVGP